MSAFEPPTDGLHYVHTLDEDGVWTATPRPGHSPYPCDACIADAELRARLDQVLAHWFNLEIELVGGRGPERAVTRAQIVDAIVDTARAYR